MIQRALISVSDKRGIEDFARSLVERGVEIVSTGGTKALLEKAGLPVIAVEAVTGFPEGLDGRIKTLHPLIFGGLLAERSKEAHQAFLATHGIQPLDLVVVNLYPFREVLKKGDFTRGEAIENIDIGGPSMLRAAAKNYQDVVVVTDPGDYSRVLESLSAEGTVSLDLRLQLAAKAFEETAAYDALISGYLLRETGGEALAPRVTRTYEKVEDLRYGENPQQKAAFYREVPAVKGTLSEAVQLHGKALSYNNIGDTAAALSMVREYEGPAVVAVKHANPCGIGLGDTIGAAFAKAYAADPVSIFGGIVALNRPVDGATARAMEDIFLEVVVAPAFDEEALALLTRKKNLRLLTLEAEGFLPPREDPYALELKKVEGGLLLQSADADPFQWADMTVVTERLPTEKEKEDLLLAWKAVMHVKSNAIVVAKDGATTGIGGGQTSRIWAAEEALARSGAAAKGAVLASDAFFPFGDVVEAAHAHGITAIIQPGGSLRDQESIDRCNAFGIAMVFTGRRHFKH